MPSKRFAGVSILLLISPEAKEQSEMFPFSLCHSMFVPNSLFPKAGGSFITGTSQKCPLSRQEISDFQQDGLLYSGFGT